MSPEDERRYKEKLEILDGSRSRQRLAAAVRIEDLKGLLQIKDRLQAQKAAGAAPTAAEYDTLLADVEYIRARLFEVMSALRAKLTP